MPSHQRTAPAAAHARRAITALTALSLLAAAACGHSETTAPDPGPGEPGEIPSASLDASKGWAYFSLSQGARVTPSNPAMSSEWDIAFNATNVMLNGGHAGPGGVTGYCLCQNTATNPDAATILAYTPESELADLVNVTSSRVPAASSFIADDLTPAISGWYTGSGASASAATDRAWLLRLHGGKSYAKLRVTSLTQPSISGAGTVRIEYAVQPEGSSTLGATRTLDVAVPATGQVRVDLASGTILSGSETDWDIAFEGWLLRVNGGVSGSGSTGATPATEPFEGITDVTAITASQAFKNDTFAGVFASSPWYRYDLAGDHGISPTFDVYLVRRGSQVYKLQVTDYYGPAGESRQITIRYAPVTD